MAKLERFEDLQSWQKGRQLANQIYELTLHVGFSRDFRLRDQINDAAGSEMHNITEGFDAGSHPEFILFFKMSRRSASEVQSELYLALDRKYINTDDLNTVYSLATETKRLINGMIAYLRKSSAGKK
ncbi:MAG: four helix bundle protein [Anaerolineales bacterium]